MVLIIFFRYNLGLENQFKIKVLIMTVAVLVLSSTLMVSCKDAVKKEVVKEAVLGCKDAVKKEVVKEAVLVVEENPVVEVTVDEWVIDEHQMNAIPLTSKATVASKEKAEDKAEEEAYEIATMEEFHTDMAELEYEAS